jgi:hypothetical protein
MGNLGGIYPVIVACSPTMGLPGSTLSGSDPSPVAAPVKLAQHFFAPRRFAGY